MVVVVVAFVGFVLGSVMRSPEERALETEAPELGWLAVPVKFGHLGSDVVARGQVVGSASATVELPGLAGDGLVATDLPATGDSFQAGQSVLGLEGRPLLLLSGSEPLYRDLAGGDEGTDVEAVQRALVVAGLDPGPVDGYYGPKMAAAVEELYLQVGYPPPVSPITDDELAEAEAAVADGREAVRQAKLSGESSDYAIASAKRSLQRSIERFDDLKLAAITPFPLVEMALVPAFPISVLEVSGSLGRPATERAVVLANPHSVVILAPVSRDVANRLEADQPVKISVDGADTAPGTVSWVASQVGEEPVQERYGPNTKLAPGQVGVEVQPDSRLDLAVGTPVSLHFELFITDEPGLLVPQGAIRTDADGHTWVAVTAAEDNFRRVDVSLGQSTDGEVLVTSTDLAEHDQVILGPL